MFEELGKMVAEVHFNCDPCHMMHLIQRYGVILRRKAHVKNQTDSKEAYINPHVIFSNHS